MNKRNIAPWKPLLLAFGATVLTATALSLALIALLTAPESSLPFESDPQAVLLAATAEPTPLPIVFGPQATSRPADRNDKIPTQAPQPAETAAAPPAATPVPLAPQIVREPVSVDPPAAPTPAPTPAPTAVPTPVPIPGGYRPDLTEQLYTLLNNERTSRGLSAVTRNPSLVGSAEYYARLIFLRDPYVLDHWLDGGPGDRAWSRGYCCGVGEILVESEGSAEGMVDLWMDSAPHKSVILDPQYVSAGIACYDGPFVGQDGNLHHPIVCVGDFGSG